MSATQTRAAAIVMPLQHFTDGGGAARIFEQQARALRDLGWRVAVTFTAPRVGLRGAPAKPTSLQSIDSVSYASAVRPLRVPEVLARSLAARVRRRWSLADDLAISRLIDADSAPRPEREFAIVICNYLQGLTIADRLAPRRRQVLVLHDLDPGPVPRWLVRLINERGATATLTAQDADRLVEAGVTTPCAAVFPGLPAALPTRAVSSAGAALDECGPKCAPDGGWRASVWGDRRAIDLLFVGSAHPPNIDGLRRFFDECFVPHLVPRGVTLAVAGESGVFALSRRTAPGLARLGRVANLASLYSACKLAIVPVLRGTGVSIKTIEAVHAGLPVLGTPAAWRGLNAPDGALLDPPFDRRWADHIAALLDDESARHSLARDCARSLQAATNSTTLAELIDLVIKRD